MAVEGEDASGLRFNEGNALCLSFSLCLSFFFSWYLWALLVLSVLMMEMLNVFFEKNTTEKIAEKTLSHFLSVSFSLFSILCTLALAVNVSGVSLA